MKHLLILAATVLTFTFVSAQNLIVNELTVPEHISKQMPRVNKNFVLKTPTKLNEERKSPLLIWLHGGGGWTNTNGEGWPKISKHISEKYPFAILFPQSIGVGWDGASMEVLVKYIIENYPIDSKRVYLAGGSMGGAGTWLVANHNPDLYAALVPCMGGGRVREEILDVISFEKLKKKPVWAFGGRLDKATPIEYAIEIDSILNSIGGNAKLTIYENMGHGGPVQEAFKNEELYIWLMQQKGDQ